jgi:nucleoside-diphosphate-sugar epimerase
MNVRGSSVVVTGIGGFIGLRLAEVLRDAGASVKGLELPGPAATRAKARGFEVVEGDVTSEASGAEVVRGADVVVHTAAIVGEGGDLEQYRAVNVGGALTMARAARSAGARRFVHLSSVMVHGFSFPPNVTEDGPLRGEGNAYCQTKIESEAALQPLHEPGRFELTIIRPGDVYGPGSVPWIVRPLALMKQGLFALPDGGRGVINHVHVDSLCDGIRLALEEDASGAFCLADGVATSCRDYFGHLARMSGTTLRSVPSWLLLGAFSVIAPAFEALKKTPPARADAVRYLLRPHAYSIEKAKAVLGYRPLVPLDAGMRGVEAWARGVGLLS